MTPAYAAFTERGLRLAEKLAASLPGSVTRRAHEVLRALEATAPKNAVCLSRTWMTAMVFSLPCG